MLTFSILAGIDQSFALRSHPSTVGLEAWMRSVLSGRPLIAQTVNGVVYDSALLSLMYDVQQIYNAHLQDGVVSHTAPDAANELDIQPLVGADLQVINVFNYFAANYARPLGLAEFTPGIPERNDAWSDKANFVAYLWNMTQLLNNCKTSYNLHRVALVHSAPDMVNIVTAPTITIPTPDGVVPSLKYVDGWSKALVEIERSEPAFIKGKIGTWLKDIMTLGMALVTAYSAHIADGAPGGTIHVAPDVTNVFSTQPVSRL